MACIDKILEKFPELSETEVKIIEKELKAIKKNLKAQGKLDNLDNALDQAIQDGMDNIEIQSIIQKRNIQKGILKRKGLDTDVNTGISASVHPKHVLEDVIQETNKKFKRSQPSVDVMAESIESRYSTGFHNDVVSQTDNKVPKLFSKKWFNRDIATELWNLEDGANKSVTGNEDAFIVAKSYDKWKEIARKRLNEAGAFIRRLKGHIIAQSWDVLRVTKDFDKWKSAMVRLLNHEKTFGNDDPDEFLKAVFGNIASGKYGIAEESKGISVGPGSMARSVSRSRVLHFKDAPSFIEAHDLYGHGSIMEGILASFHTMGKKTAMMERLGPNPRYTFESAIEKYTEKYKGTKFNIAEKDRKWLERVFDETSGIAAMPENPRMANIIASVKAVNNASKLGMATATSFVDTATSAANANYHGIGFFSAYYDIFKGMLQMNISEAERRINYDLLHIGFEGLSEARFNLNSIGSGFSAKLNNFTFKLNLLTWWTNKQKVVHAKMLSHWLAINTGKSFDDIYPNLRTALTNRGISQDKWNIMQHAVFKTENGKTFLTPDSLRDIDDELFSGFIKGKKTPKKLAQAKTELEDQLRAFFISEADIAVPTPRARERSIARWGRPGSLPGAVGELFWQFKMFPLTLITKVWPRQIQNGVPGIMHLMIMSTLFGYGALTIKDLLKGRTPRDPFSLKTWIDSFIAGGAGSVYADFLFQNFNKYGRSFMETFPGPTFSVLGDLFKLKGDGSALKAFNFLWRNMPFSNLFYTKLATDYLFVWAIQDALNPDYLSRMEKRIKKENRQNFYIQPSNMVR